MRLTKSVRETICDAIMADVPKIDYTEERSKIANEEAFNQLPVELREAINKNKEVRNYLESCWNYKTNARVLNRHYEPSEEVVAKCEVISTASGNQSEARRKMEGELMGALRSCPTTEKFIKLFPEFEKYVPAQYAPVKGLPCTQIIADLAAMGWRGKGVVGE